MRFAICNETFAPLGAANPWPWERICRFVKESGYDGIEIAPFTFAPDVREIAGGRRKEIRRVAEEAGLAIAGLHWLLVSPPGLHVHTKNETVRQATLDYLKALIDFAGDLGAPTMIFGSPRQRALEEGDRAGAWARTQESYRALLPLLQARRVVFCQESLPAPECDFIQTAREAAQMVAEIAHPQFQMMLDVKSLCSDEAPPPALIRRYAGITRHFHANDANRRGPGFGDTDFVPIAAALKDVGYTGWVSVEVFDYSPDPETIARQSLKHLQDVFR